MAFMDEPTFTLEEFVYSWVPGKHWVPRDIEGLGYTTGKIATVILPVAAKAAYIYRWGNLTAATIAMHGGRWQAATYVATQESFGMYRLFSRGARFGRFMTNPLTAPIAVALAVAYSIPPDVRDASGMTGYERYQAEMAGKWYMSHTL